MKTIVRSSLRAFFNGRPSLALPAADGLFVALPRFADGPLRAPAERPRDLPDMALVIAHAELVSDQTSDPRTAPQRRREALRLGAFQQQRLEAFELRGVQQRLTAGAAGLAQPGFAVTPVSSQPLADALPRDLQSPRCLGLTTALLDQPDRFETALLQGLEIPPYAFCISHTYKDVRTPKRCHFILRDSIIGNTFASLSSTPPLSAPSPHAPAGWRERWCARWTGPRQMSSSNTAPAPGLSRSVFSRC